MKELYMLIENLFDKNRWKKIATSIYEIERKFCYSDFEKSARLCRDELKSSGAKDVELIKLKADGETTYGDFIMPQAWDCEYAKLEIVEPEQFKGKVLADTYIHPFHIANRSCAINKRVFEVIDKKRMQDSKNLGNCFVFCGNIHPKECRNEIEITGAKGIISSFSKAPELRDGIFWVNGWVKNSGWYHTREDRKMACFSITPEDGDFLQTLLNSCRVKVKAVVKSKIYDGRIHSITGLIPGKTKKEICFLAHLYEPMITDNATGVAGLIELCRVFSRIINEEKIIPETGIRFLFSMERYGMMEFFEKKHNVIYAFNVDSIADDIVKTGSLHYTFYGSPSNLPFFGDWLFEHIFSCFFRYPWKKKMPVFEDDTFVSDSSIGIPSGYFLSHPGKLHHNSYLETTVNWQQGENVLCVLGTYALLLSCPKNNLETLIETSARKELFSYLEMLSANAIDSKNNFDIQTIKEKVDYFAEYLKKKYFSAQSFNIRCRKKFVRDIDAFIKEFLKDISSRIREKQNGISPLSNEDRKAQNLIITKRRPVFIFSLAGIPHSKRIHPPEYFHNIINRVDGKKDLYRIYREVNFEREIFGLPAFEEKEKEKLRKYIEYLAKSGYLECKTG